MSYESEMAKKWMRIKLADKPNVISHIEKVSEKVLEIGNKLKSKGYKVNLDLLETGSYLHDIGRSVTFGVGHAIESGRIARELGFSESVIRLVERHVGAGITAEEAEKLGLPKKNFIPQTLEEKILSYADKFVESKIKFKTIKGEQIVERVDLKCHSVEPTLNKFRKIFGSRSPIVLRMMTLRDEMEKLLNN